MTETLLTERPVPVAERTQEENRPTRVLFVCTGNTSAPRWRRQWHAIFWRRAVLRCPKPSAR